MAEQGRTAYVTGGASGIGKAVVEMLVERGAKVFIADQNISAAESLAASLNQESKFRRQENSDGGFRGKLLCVSSICGLYAVATMPVYTAAKHGVVGLVRSYGKFLPEGITMNAICPNITRTNLAPQSLFDAVEEQKALAPMAGVLEAFSAMLDPSNISGGIFETGPNRGYARREGVEYLDAESRRGAEMLNDSYIP